MEFRLLGAVEAWTDDRQIDLGPRKQRLVCGVLALRVNQLVTVDRLVDLTWPTSPPQTAQHAIHSRVSRLRAALAEADTTPPAVAIVTHGSSYVLRADPMTVDAHRFRARLAEAGAEIDDLKKVSILRQAFDLWHGPPLADVATPVVADQLCRGLEEAKLTALEECLDAELRLGRHGRVIGELIELVAHHPYRQRLLAQLMLALYRGGRGPDALAAYGRARDQLADELGLDPDPRLQRLYSAILCAEPVLDLPAEPPPTPPPPAEAAVELPGPRHPADVAGQAPRVENPGPAPPTRSRRIVRSLGGAAARSWSTTLRLLGLSTGRSHPAGSGQDYPLAWLDVDRPALADAFPTPHRAGAWMLAREWVMGWREGATAMTSLTVEAERLTKRYRRHTAIDELSFTAGQGDVLGLLGSNGAGKTTTIRLLTTMLMPTSGQFTIAGIPSSRPTEIRSRVGVLPESAGYPGQQTGLDYLAYHARLFGMNRSEAGRVAGRLLSELGLDERAGSRISTYSRGMRQRLGIARALLNEPAVVFLDEPTLGLDPGGQRQVLGIIRDIAERSGATVLLSTHTLPEVEEVCTRVVILDRGRIAASGTVAEVTPALSTRPAGQVRVPVEQAGRAVEAFTGLAGVSVDASEDRPDVLRVSLTGPLDAGPSAASDTPMNAVLQALLSAGVVVLSYEVRGARLADAFQTVVERSVREP